MENIDANEMKTFMKKGIRMRYLPSLMTQWEQKKNKPQIKPFLGNLTKLYKAIQKCTNSKVIVDTSKHSGYGYMLNLIPEIDLYIIHLVRDPRAVAYSWLKKKVQPDKKETIYISRYSPFKSCLQWNIRNFFAEYFWKKTNKYLLLRYEDFIDNPKESLSQALELVKEKSDDIPFIDGHKVKLGINHGIWGNPSRFQMGEIELKKDEEWKVKMKSIDKVLSTVYTLPLLLKYRY